jgi:hypothetical protein
LFASDVFVESKVPSDVEQLLVEQTSNVIFPVSFGSGSLKVAVSVGVYEPTLFVSPGLTRTGMFGPVFAVLFVMKALASEAVTAALPVGVAVSRTMGSLPGFVYVRLRVSRWWTALESVKRVWFAAG